MHPVVAIFIGWFAAPLITVPLLSVTFLLVMHYLVWPPPRKTPTSPPLVSGMIPFVGVGVAFGRNPKQFLESCRRKHGDVFCL